MEKTEHTLLRGNFIKDLEINQKLEEQGNDCPISL